MFVTGRPPTTAQWPLQGWRAAKTPSAPCRVASVQEPAPSQSREVCGCRRLLVQRSVSLWTPPGWECAKPTPPKVGVCDVDASSFKERVTVDASRVGVCQADAFPEQGSVRCRRLLIQRSVRKLRLAPSGGKCANGTTLAPRAPSNPESMKRSSCHTGEGALRVRSAPPSPATPATTPPPRRRSDRGAGWPGGTTRRRCRAPRTWRRGAGRLPGRRSRAARRA